MLKLAEMEYNGANSIFLRLLLDKKYALPFRVLDALVAHFLSFRSEKRVLPVLWHQSLLTLAQRYKADLASEQKTSLLELLKIQTHPKYHSLQDISLFIYWPVPHRFRPDWKRFVLILNDLCQLCSQSGMSCSDGARDCCPTTGSNFLIHIRHFFPSCYS